MSWWLWLLTGAVLALILSGLYPCYLICRRVLSLKRDLVEPPKPLNQFDGEIDIFIPLEMVKEVTIEELTKRRGLTTYHVFYSQKKWKIKRGRNKVVYAEGNNKNLVTKLAILYAKKDKAELKIHNKSGQIKSSNSYGNDPRGNG